jgi:chromosome segregation ATPase
VSDVQGLERRKEEAALEVLDLKADIEAEQAKAQRAKDVAKAAARGQKLLEGLVDQLEGEEAQMRLEEMMKVIEGGKKEVARISAAKKKAEEERIAAEKSAEDARTEAAKSRKALEEVQRALEESEISLEESRRNLDESHRAHDAEEQASWEAERAMEDARGRVRQAEATLSEVLAKKGDAEATLAEVLGRVGEAERLATSRGDEAEEVGRRVEAAWSMIQAIIAEVSSLGAELEEVCGSLDGIRSVPASPDVRALTNLLRAFAR